MICAASAPSVFPLRLCVIPSLGKWNREGAKTGRRLSQNHGNKIIIAGAACAMIL
jgi:hypothetical protein